MTVAAVRVATALRVVTVRIHLAVAVLRRTEPARVVALVRAVLGLAALVGIAVPAGLDLRVEAVIGGVFTLLTVWQAESTRALTTPTASLPEQPTEQ
jgi:hypothetical protein